MFITFFFYIMIFSMFFCAIFIIIYFSLIYYYNSQLTRFLLCFLSQNHRLSRWLALPYKGLLHACAQKTHGRSACCTTSTVTPKGTFLVLPYPGAAPKGPYRVGGYFYCDTIKIKSFPP